MIYSGNTDLSDFSRASNKKNLAGGRVGDKFFLNGKVIFFKSVVFVLISIIKVYGSLVLTIKHFSKGAKC